MLDEEQELLGKSALPDSCLFLLVLKIMTRTFIVPHKTIGSDRQVILADVVSVPQKRFNWFGHAIVKLSTTISFLRIGPSRRLHNAAIQKS